MIIFYLKEAVRILRRSSIATFVTILITFVAIALTVLSGFILFEANVLSNKMKKSIEVNVYLDNTLSSAEINNLRNTLIAEPGVSSVQLIEKDEAAKEFIKETGNDFMKVLDSNPLPNSFVIKFKPDPLDQVNIEAFTRKYKKVSGITDIVYDYKTVLKLLSYLKSSQNIVYVIAVFLIFLSLYLVYSNNKAQIRNNKNLYLTMKLVGAKIISMKIPIILNGIIVGLISSILCIILYNFTMFVLIKFYSQLNFLPQQQIIDLVILLIGVFLGLIGSIASANRIKKLLDVN